MTKIESNLALTITIITFRKIIHYYLHQDHVWIEEVRLSPGFVETLRQITQLIFSAFHSQPLARTPQHFYPGEIRSKWMSRANWKRMRSKKKMDPWDWRGWIELNGGVNTWFAMGSLDLRGCGWRCEPQALSSMHQMAELPHRTLPAAWSMHLGGTGLLCLTPLSARRSNYSWNKCIAIPGWIKLNWLLTGLWLREPAAAVVLEELVGSRVGGVGKFRTKHVMGRHRPTF